MKNSTTRKKNLRLGMLLSVCIVCALFLDRNSSSGSVQSGSSNDSRIETVDFYALPMTKKITKRVSHMSHSNLLGSQSLKKF